MEQEVSPLPPSPGHARQEDRQVQTMLRGGKELMWAKVTVCEVEGESA